jgi:hypothetical protein
MASPDQGRLFLGDVGHHRREPVIWSARSRTFVAQWRTHQWMPAMWQLIESALRAICSPIHHRDEAQPVLHTADDVKRSGEDGVH